MEAAYLEWAHRSFQQEEKHSTLVASLRNNFLISRLWLCLYAAGRKATEHGSSKTARPLDVKVGDTGFLGLCRFSLYKSVFLPASPLPVIWEGYVRPIVPGPIAWAALENLFEMQILRPHSRPAKSALLGLGTRDLCFNKPQDSDTHSSLRTMVPGDL